jgi:hypothetical protein
MSRGSNAQRHTDGDAHEYRKNAFKKKRDETLHLALDASTLIGGHIIT